MPVALLNTPPITCHCIFRWKGSFVSTSQPSLFGAPHDTPPDPQLEAVRASILTADPQGQKFGAALRRTFDMLLDGQHTGRFRWEQLHKTEKTHAGTLVEINLQ